MTALTALRAGPVQCFHPRHPLSGSSPQPSHHQLTLKRELAKTRDLPSLAAPDAGNTRRASIVVCPSVGQPDAVPQNDEERRQLYEMKRRIVKMLVDEALIEKDKCLRLVFHLDVSSCLSRLE